MKTSGNNDNLLNSWETEGQLGAKKVLQNFIRSTEHSDSQLPHAFLFLGPRASGKYSLAKEFGKKIASSISNHSEIFEFDFNTANSLDELRELIKFSSLTSHDQFAKTIFLLRNFQAASIGAQNTLLKTLEEPSSSSIFILVSNNNTEIPTIMSRCVPIRCYTIHADVGQSIKDYPNLEPVLAHLQDSKPGLLMHLKTLQEFETEELQILMQLWVEKLLSIITGSDVAKVIKKIAIAQTASQDLQKNYNPKLILQEFLLQTEKIV